MRTIYARQGDLIIDRVESAPCDLIRSAETVVVAGSHDGVHSIPAGVLIGKRDRSTYVLSDVDTQIVHATRHRPVPLRAGVTYSITPQIERRGDGDFDVED